MNAVVILLLVLLFVGGLGGLHPGISANYGYWPSGVGGLLFIVLLVLRLSGRF